MKNKTLDNLVRLGSISGYEYKTIKDVNNRNEIGYSEQIVLFFNNGEKLVLNSTGSENTELLIGN
jgi:hypothetical protein